MATSVKQMMEAANATVPRITPAQAREMMADGNTLVVDVRDGPEVEKSGKVAGAVHVSRGELVQSGEQRRRQGEAVLTADLPAAALLAGNADGVDAGQLGRGAKIAHMAVDLRREGVEGQEARPVDAHDRHANAGVSAEA
jgi:hypothetical protein